MENIDPSLLQQFLENNSSGSNTAPTVNLLPESFISMVTIGFIALNVIATLFLIVYVLGVVRKWKVQSAILEMHKDVRDIKQQLITKEKAPKPIDTDTAKIA